jgi:hypothetical protein
VIDVSKIRKGVKVRLEDGGVRVVVGVYLSATGLMLSVKPENSGQMAAQPVNLEMVAEILEG